MKQITITDKKEMYKKIDYWTTIHISCSYYEFGGNKVIVSYNGEQVTYINDDVKSVCWVAANCNGASMRDLSKLSNKLWDEEEKNKNKAIV